ncbi:MAG: Na/Pi cotransporter family protein [Vallitaleaceae bacterium]|nr:Na/Pi cotransporter family protein [Vallitaleaceae bacterium]
MKEFIFGLIGGTALLMYGVDKMGDGLENASSKIMRKILSVLTGNVYMACLVGIVTTVLVQSSTAITVLTVGFVNAGLMKLSQAIGIIYGANIGTTVTAQLMAFSFKFKLTEIALPVIGIGFAINYFAKREGFKHIGNAMMGFGMMFLGLKILNSGIPFIKTNEALLGFFQNYASLTLVGIILGAVATAMVHSSSATVGLVLMLGQAGAIGLPGAIAIMLGDNIGTCITAQLASLSGNINARRTAWAHTLYNVIGVILCVILMKPFMDVILYITHNFNRTDDIGLQIANSHTVFNVLSAILFLPLNKYYVKFLETIIRDKKANKYEPLDKLLIHTPVAAFRATLQETVVALTLVRSMINKSLEAFYTNKKDLLDDVRQKEEQLNEIQKNIISYIVEVSKQPLTDEYSPMIPAFINSINNIERAGDHTIEYMGNIITKIDKDLKLTEDSLDELKYFQSIIIDMIDITVNSITNKDLRTVSKMSELEEASDNCFEQSLNNHIKRLEGSKCSVEAGIIFVDLITHMERIADHIYKVFMISISDELVSHL